MNTSTPTPTPPPPVARSSGSAIVGIALAVLAMGVGWWIWREPAVPPSRPPPGEIVLEETIDFRGGPVDRRLLSPGPSVFSVEVTPAGGSRGVTVTLGPPLPATNTEEGGPDPLLSTVVRGDVGKGVTADFRVYSSGIQVLRIETSGDIPTLGGGRGETVRVRRRPGP